MGLRKEVHAIIQFLLDRGISKHDAVSRILALKDGDLPELYNFKQRRINLCQSMGWVSSKCEVSKATISRIESGKDAEYSTVKKLHEFYIKNKV